MSAEVHGEETITISVPASAYAFKNFPECAGFRETVHEMMRDEGFLAAVGAANQVAGAIVGAIGQMDGLSAKHGGELSKLWRNSVGGSKSSCVTVAFALPTDASPTTIALSNRNGGDPRSFTVGDLTEVLAEPLVVVQSLDREDWSGWRDVTVARKDRFIVLATAVNWQHNAATQQQMTIRW